MARGMAWGTFCATAGDELVRWVMQWHSEMPFPKPELIRTADYTTATARARQYKVGEESTWTGR